MYVNLYSRDFAFTHDQEVLCIKYRPNEMYVKKSSNSSNNEIIFIATKYHGREMLGLLFLDKKEFFCPLS